MISAHFLSIIKTFQHSCKVKLTSFRRWRKNWDMERKTVKNLNDVIWRFFKIFRLFSGWGWGGKIICMNVQKFSDLIRVIELLSQLWTITDVPRGDSAWYSLQRFSEQQWGFYLFLVLLTQTVRAITCDTCFFLLLKKITHIRFS